MPSEENSYKALAAGLSHDFGNIFTPIMWSIESLTESTKDCEEAKEDLEILQLAIEQAQTIISNLSVIGSSTEIDSENIEGDFLDQWKKSENFVEIQNKHPNQEWKFEFDDCSNLRINKSALATTLDSLLLYTTSKTSGDGTLTVTSNYDSENNVTNIDFQYEVKNLPCINDNKIFNPYATSKEQGVVGSGLTLALAKNLSNCAGAELSLKQDNETRFFRLSVPSS